MVEQRADLTFQYNLKQGRHGWLRLTPAYSVKIVRQILADQPQARQVLDPFSGTGTTGLVCAENGFACDLVEINPFLVWLARVKTASYRPEHLQKTESVALNICAGLESDSTWSSLWVPPIHNIERWWPQDRLITLARVYQAIHSCSLSGSPIQDLLLLSFCNLVIHWSNAAFSHQSMSFQDDRANQLTFFDQKYQILSHFMQLVRQIVQAAYAPLSETVRVFQGDARQVDQFLPLQYDCVITSPPYPNRMSYIRELRPYMYWLGYLETGRQAGELDWEAIGGTWGIATSRLESWRTDGRRIFYPLFDEILARIAEQSLILSSYVHRYFVDISTHLAALYHVLTPGAKVFYIVGNSKFYDVLVPVEKIYQSILQSCGFIDIDIQVIRKRNSKKDLFEYVVSSTRPG
ncbi:MAG: SAM-dependent methyltransferase [Anaerolineae bacterium]|nr:SAM-dependent methyltransferase [Anaerolineae bacterium]